MGGELGYFDVSAFPGGSGFFIQRVESGESLITTLIDDEGKAGGTETYVMVYSHPGHEKLDTAEDSRANLGESGSRLGSMSNSERTEAEVTTIMERSVLVADLQGNAFVCQIEIVESKIGLEQDGVEVCSEGDEEECTSESEKVIARYPCAPALFGPTHMSELAVAGGIMVQASIRGPELGEEYGCINKRYDGVGEEYMPMDIQNEEDSSPNSIPHTHSDQSTELDDDTIQDAFSAQTCKNTVVQLLQRGVCTFQEKSMNQRKSFNAEAVIMINSERDELFVMSGGGSEDPEYSDNDNFPATVLVTGSDGQHMLDVVNSFESNDVSQLLARVSLIREEIEIVESDNSFAVEGNKHWPAIRVQSEVLQIFAQGGWGVHAVPKNDKTKSGSLEWQLYLMQHQT
jgi:hypothetical protein